MPYLVTAAVTDRFIRHPRARIMSAEQDLAATASLDAAFAKALLGHPFRIGGEGEPRTGPQPMFETLTSGTTGAPRRIWRSQASWTASFVVNGALFGIGPGTSVAILGQLVHSLALYGALEALHLGADLHLLARHRPDRQRGLLAAEAVEILYATPAQARLLVDAKGPVLTGLRLLLIGGSKLDPALRAGLREMAPKAGLREFYGAAETSFLTLAAPGDPPESVGQAYPGVQLSIRDAQGRLLPEGEGGEVWAKSPYLFAGYAAEQGSAVWQDGWLSVGEIGHLAKGALYLTGRKSRAVQIADQTVYPEAIEAFMANLPGIRHIAVLAQADCKRGAVLIAVAQGQDSQEQAILSATRGRFGPLRTPRRIIWRADWPVLASGKPDLAALQKELS